LISSHRAMLISLFSSTGCRRKRKQSLDSSHNLEVIDPTIGEWN